jgi:hypothetical protein
MLRPHLKALRVLHHLWQAGHVRAVGLQVRQQVIIGAAVTVPPVIDGAGQFPFLATSIEPYQALMICPAMVGISSS